MVDKNDLDAFFDEVEEAEEEAKKESEELLSSNISQEQKDSTGKEEIRKEFEVDLPTKKGHKGNNGVIVIARKPAVSNLGTPSSFSPSSTRNPVRNPSYLKGVCSQPLLPNTGSKTLLPAPTQESSVGSYNLPLTYISSPQPPPPLLESVFHKKSRKRTAAGQTWEDATLPAFPENDFRLFVGNIAKDITDVKLTEAFSSRYQSFSMARVCYNSSNNTSKGYGFVSLMDYKDCARAIREMDQSWLGSRPIKVKRSEWKDRDLKKVRKKKKR